MCMCMCVCVCSVKALPMFMRVPGYYYYFLRFRLARQEVINFNRIIFKYDLLILELFEVLDSLITWHYESEEMAGPSHFWRVFHTAA